VANVQRRNAENDWRPASNAYPVGQYETPASKALLAHRQRMTVTA
jgi:hypothetical protein